MRKTKLQGAQKSSIRVASERAERVNLRVLEAALARTLRWLEDEVSPFAKRASRKTITRVPQTSH